MELITILTIVTVLMGIAAIALVMLENKIKKDIEEKKKPSKKTVYRRKIKRLLKSNKKLNNKLDQFENLIKNIFKESYNFPKSKDFSTLRKKFRDKNIKRGKELCDQMLTLKYSGKEIKRKVLEKVSDKLKSIINKDLD